MSDLSALIERVRAATGADRELDADIVCSLFPNIGRPAPQCIGDEPIFWHDPYRKMEVPRLTSSLDDAVALVERVLPGWEWNVWRPVAEDAWACISREGTLQDFNEQAPTAPLALILALLMAMEAQRD